MVIVETRRRARKKWNNYDAFNERASARDTRTPLFALLLAKLRHKKWRRTLVAIAATDARRAINKQPLRARKTATPKGQAVRCSFFLLRYGHYPAQIIWQLMTIKRGLLLDDAYFGNIADMH
jgi:hypothetical protein